jgi:hypothetical protein
MPGYAPAAVRSDDTMRVLSTQIGLVMSCVAAPASRLARKKSVGESTERAGTPSDEKKGRPWPAFREARARSARDLKKKKDAQLDALPIRLGVRPR